MFDFILSHRYLKDNIACRLFAQLASAVQYLHAKGIVHRDLKLENLLLDRNRNIIVTDFGFANTFDPRQSLEDIEAMRKRDALSNGQIRGDLMHTSCGSPCYAAPELVISDGSYCGRKVDVWSCGVILYAMLAGYLPFDDDPMNPEGDNISLLYKYIVNTPLTFPEYVTPLARDLLRRILVPDPRERASLRNVVAHSWLGPQVRYLLDNGSQTSAEQRGSQEMLRSSSERASQHAVISKSQAHGGLATPAVHIGEVKNKRHSHTPVSTQAQTTVQPQVSKISETESPEHMVESLHIAATPGMTRSTSHTGANMSKTLAGEASSTTETVAEKRPRAIARLPAPQGKPRPTSYHPAYVNHDLSASVTPMSTIHSTTSLQTTVANPFSPNTGHLKDSRTASPRSTRQNAAGEIYSPPATAVSRPGSQMSQVISIDAAERKHKRNSSSIGNMVAAISKIWPYQASESKTSRRDSQVTLTQPALGSIGEISSTPTTSASKSTKDRRRSSLHVLSQKFSPSGSKNDKSRYRHSMLGEAPISESVPETSNEQPRKDKSFLESLGYDKSARRVLDFFTYRKRSKVEGRG